MKVLDWITGRDLRKQRALITETLDRLEERVAAIEAVLEDDKLRHVEQTAPRGQEWDVLG